MAVTFARPYPVIRNPGGSYVDGAWVDGAEPAPANVPLLIIGAGASDYERVSPEAGGQGAKGLKAALSDAELDYGDTVMVDGDRYEIIGRDRRDAFGGSETSHWRYLLTRDIAPGG